MTDFRVSLSTFTLGLAAGCALLLAPAVARAEQPADAPAPAAEQATQAIAETPTQNNPEQTIEGPAVDGLRAYVDEQGHLRPPTEAEQLERSRGGLTSFGVALRQQVPVKSADGTLSLVLDTSYLQSAVAHVGEDGKIHWNCAEHSAETAAKPAAPEVK